jgi:hypothetical protein
LLPRLTFCKLALAAAPLGVMLQSCSDAAMRAPMVPERCWSRIINGAV